MVDSSAPMPWIGLYAAAATLVWVFALIADIIHSLRRRKLWFPCKYSALNATSLTVIAVAVKLAMDSTTSMPASMDQFAKFSSTALLCASTIHFMPSLGSMSDPEILTNLTALGILIVTLTVNVVIQLFTGVIKHKMKVLHAVIVFLNLYSFIVLISSALTVSASKRHLEQKYNTIQGRILGEELHGNQLFDFEKLKLRLKKYWVMARTSSPQYVMARSDACYILGLISNVVLMLLLIETSIYPFGWEDSSGYKWSVKLIFVTQVLAVSLCFLTSFIRFIRALILNIRHVRGFFASVISFDMQTYGIQILVNWKKRPPPSQVRDQKLRKIIHVIRNLLLNICIGGQVGIVMMNKLLVIMSILLAVLTILFLVIMSPFLLIFLSPLIILLFKRLKKKLLGEYEASVNPNETTQEPSFEQDLRNFLVLVEGEAMQDIYLKFIHTSINSFITVGANNHPRYLIELLENSTSLKGVMDFESDQVPSILGKEPPNCWTLTIVNLTSIMIALPNIEQQKKNKRLQSVIEGFKYARLVEESLDEEKKLVSSRDAADFVWAGTELKHRWLDIDLQKVSRLSNSNMETLQTLSYKSEETVKEFTNKMERNTQESLVNLSEDVVVANSMYKISRTLLLDCEESSHSQSDAHVFDKLSVMVADIFVACLTNLPHVILMKCYNSTIEERVVSVEEAACLLGETQGILKALQKHEIPNLSPDRSVYIDQWRALLKHSNNNTSTSTSSSENTITDSTEVHFDTQEIHSTVMEGEMGSRKDIWRKEDAQV
ncbi:uncharacterized protein LOC111398751 isoform X2 [Olea europaea var. sylvestris]|uniref:uncharacterized protein LOC111398751 isoform X2 n=1 Tax=Olea europaea var. sylvestris TaxID=158386 RepID=UPI000C1D80D9|nr:uncharacterized protein LOC111398751 isoform X2 [Olea europaea var. sylvestris]